MTRNSPRPSVRHMDKSFTVEEANRTLPLVKRIVEDLVRDHRAWSEKVREFEVATVGSSPDMAVRIRAANSRPSLSAIDGCWSTRAHCRYSGL